MSNQPNDTDQQTRRQVLKDTYFSRASADADMIGGRFKRETETRVTGVPSYPRQPESSPWASDPVPPEEPLGYDINALPELGGAPVHALAETATPPGDGLSSPPDNPSSFSSRTPRRSW